MKSTISFEKYSMLGANLGRENPLPDLFSKADIHAKVEYEDSISHEEAKYFTYGKISSILPYRMQDGYDRNKVKREYDCVVLENQYLKATFFPQFGGRLWSLYDKEHQRDLLHVNPVFQPANLALRNAWISGGVEWNIGMIGHSPFTLAPLHTATGTMEDGTPFLRMYEWERIRQATFQIDAYLPDDSRYLLLRMQITNTTDQEVPMYWWSNIAVDETPKTRVLAPTPEAFVFNYGRAVSKGKMPFYRDRDTSYSMNIPEAMDLFYDLPRETRKWESALDQDGKGLVQTSTDLLQGRKLFLWGNSPGGRRWQEFLASPGKAYIEIQAGLANTQLEHVPMPANEQWEWLEAYGYMEADPEKVHGTWETGYHAVGEQLEQCLPREFMDQELKRLTTALNVPAAPYKKGSGWGALELLRRQKEADVFRGQIPFPADTLEKEQQPWLELLQTGIFPLQDSSQEPAAYLVQKEWISLLEDAVKKEESNHWHSWLQLGVMYADNGMDDKGYKAFETSHSHTPNGWALRNLATLEMRKDNMTKAGDLLLQAAKYLKILPLAIETGKLLLEQNRYEEFGTFFAELPADVQQSGRLRIMDTEYLIMTNQFDQALAILQGDIQVSDIREGEVTLSNLWITLHTRKHMMSENLEDTPELRQRILKENPIPSGLDFRMK